MKNRVWIIIFCAAAVVCAAACLLISDSAFSSEIVGIYQDGDLVRKIDLNSVTYDYTITLNGSAGENVICVSRGSIKMESAECPDQICVNHGELTSSDDPIVCLPNKIIIKFENSECSADAITGAQ